MNNKSCTLKDINDIELLFTTPFDLKLSLQDNHMKFKPRNHNMNNTEDSLISANGEIIPRSQFENDLKKRVLASLHNQGFELDQSNQIVLTSVLKKEKIRNLHSAARDDRLESSLKFLEQKENKLMHYFADGKEINYNNFHPKIEIVKTDTRSSDIFRYASLLWSVPVSNGFGRRTRFLVWDESIHKLVGIFAIGDPVFNLSCRDSWIGWNLNQKMNRLYNIMDIFVLGSVPPYNQLLGGKLVAMIATSNEVRDIIFNKYSGDQTIIKKEIKNPHLALLTTSSALGKSSIYDRIKFDEKLLYEKIGETQGYGHFHLNNGLFEDLRNYLGMISPNRSHANRFGQGPNYKMRVAREALQHLGLPGDLLRHGIKREVYAIQLSSNCKEFLKGDDEEIIGKNMPLNDIVGFWKTRWFKNRMASKPDYIHHDHEDIPKIVREMGTK